jgi:hypothetical protein
MNRWTDNDYVLVDEINQNFDTIDQKIGEHDAQLADIAQQNYFKTNPKKYYGFNMYLPFDIKFGTYQSLIDNAVRLGANTINICIRLRMASISSEILTLETTQTDLVNAVNYAKTKGLFVFIKPHVNYSSWDIYQNVVNPQNWLTSYSNNLKTALSWVIDNVDIVSISNELRNQTSSNLDMWQTLINDIRAMKSNLIISCSIAPLEISTNLYLPYVDVIGCNLYIGVGGDLTYSAETLKKNMFRDFESNINFIDVLHKKAFDLQKDIFITEVGILPVEDALKHPSKWDYDISLQNQPEVQTLYYKVFLDTFMRDTSVKGIFIWSLADGFTPVGNIECENIIKTYFGGIQ